MKRGGGDGGGPIRPLVDTPNQMLAHGAALDKVCVIACATRLRACLFIITGHTGHDPFRLLVRHSVVAPPTFYHNHFPLHTTAVHPPLACGLTGFLQLMNMPQFKELDFVPLVPHPEMELVWQTHLTRPVRYARDTALLAGRVVHHSTARALQDVDNDKGRAFTARLWKRRHGGEDYMDPAAPVRPVEGMDELRAYLIAETRKDMRWWSEFQAFLSHHYLTGEELGPEFLGSQHEAYLKFLWLASHDAEGRMMTPPISLDLFWVSKESERFWGGEGRATERKRESAR